MVGFCHAFFFVSAAALLLPKRYSMFPMTKLLKPEFQVTLSIALAAIVQLQKARKKHGKSQPFKPYLKVLKTEISAFMMRTVHAQYLIRAMVNLYTRYPTAMGPIFTGYPVHSGMVI